MHCKLPPCNALQCHAICLAISTTCYMYRTVSIFCDCTATCITKQIAWLMWMGHTNSPFHISSIFQGQGYYHWPLCILMSWPIVVAILGAIMGLGTWSVASTVMLLKLIFEMGTKYKFYYAHCKCWCIIMTNTVRWSPRNANTIRCDKVFQIFNEDLHNFLKEPHHIICHTDWPNQLRTYPFLTGTTSFELLGKE